jgi:shikimate dehydrogenase
LKKYGLIGYPLGHSFSKDFFEKKFLREGIINSQYDLYPIEDVNDFKKILAENENLRGLNVTIPHKVNIIPLLDELHDTAKQVGAVNTIKIINGKTIGYNTDTWGFAKSLFPEITAFKSNALILGNGGASKAVQYVFNKLSILYKIVGRNKETSDYLYSDLNRKIIDEVGIIVQTTPVGMYPNIHETLEIPFEALSANHYCIDLVYNPEETLFLKKSKAAGAIVKNGMQMLIEQAEESWRIWL